MSADTVTNPPPAESNSARKKREKAEAATREQSTPAASTPTEEQTESASNGALSQHDSPYIKELQKQIRNVNKKLNSTAKLDAILAENEGVSLDELVSQRKINQDQREQGLRKPGLQATKTQLEEQIALYKKIDADYQGRMTSHADSLSSSHKAEIETLKAQLQQEAEEKSKLELRKNLLTFSQFLRAAAAKRGNVEEAETEESRAFEGVLLLVYGGDDAAVDAAAKLIEGSDDPVPSVEGALLSVKYAQVKSESISHGGFSEEDAPAVEAVSEQATTSQLEDASSDPTIAHAGLTELNDANATNGLPVVSLPEQNGIPSASTDGASANAAAETQWDNNNTAGGASAESNLDESFEMIPRPASETEAAHEPAQPQSTNSWADDATAAAAETTPAPAVPATTEEGGFQEVPGRGPRGGHRGHGEGRGRGGRGRGGFRGEGGRGRGRGGFRGEGGHRGGPRGGPRGQGAPTGGAPAPVRS